MSDRELILARVRAALSDVAEPHRADSRPSSSSWEGADASTAGTDASTELFTRRCGEYRATVTRCGAAPAEIRAAIAAACGRNRARSLVIAPELDRAWLPDGVRAVIDSPPLAPAELDRVDGALTRSAAGIAQTGTIVLDGGPGQGRRALSLICDLHVCVVETARIVADLGAAIGEIEAAARCGRPLTLISGPSATSDIELARVEGVHGPRRLEVVVAG